MTTRLTWDEYFMEVAKATALRASCPRKSVGCVIVDESQHHIVATGYNGSLPGEPHCIDEGCIMKDGHCTRSRHAEINALDQLDIQWRELDADNEPIGKGILRAYVTLEPCKKCRAALESFGVLKVDHLEDYP